MTTPGDTAATFCATLVDEWILHGVQHAVIAPGSRSTPLAVQLALRSEISLHVFHDERSASFAALGIGEATGQPAILLCTSGTAATHFHGAVVEAHQARVPMIVCTADRPPELKDVGAPQTIDQTQLFGTAVRWFHDPGVPSADASHTWRSLAARTVSLAVGSIPGPVHVNLPFREPLLGSASNLPPRRVDNGVGAAWSTLSRSHEVGHDSVEQLAKIVSGKNGVIVAGRGSSPEVVECARALNWPVFADSRSGLRVCDSNIVLAFDSILRNASFAQQMRPDVVVRIGDPPASKVLAQWIAACQPAVVQVGDTSAVTDPDHSVVLHVVSHVGQLMSAVGKRSVSASSEWLSRWSAAEVAAQTALSKWCAQNWSEPASARTLTDALSPDTHLVVSSSMPVRDVEWFGTVTPGVVVHSNRGTNGIDGVISTAVGIALATHAPTVVFVGDIACLHDSNGLLGLMARDVDVTVVVSNNDGGAIFSFLPQAGQVSEKTFELLYGTPHGVDFASLAAAHGIPFHRSTSASELQSALSLRGSRFIEVPSSRNDNVSHHDLAHASVVDAVATV